MNVSITTANTVLTIGANCAAATPCNVRVGDTVYAFTNIATATISGGSPLAYIYVDSSGTRSVGVASGTVACNANCAVTNVSQFPSGSVALWTWTAAAGAWVVNGGTDTRAWLGSKGLNTQAGAALIQSGNQIGFDTTTGLQQSMPNAASPGTTQGLLVKLAAGLANVTATTDTGGVVGICSLNCGTSGTATVVAVGMSQCVADNTVAASDYIQIGTSTAGRCLSAGPSKPSSGQIVGLAMTAATVGNSFGILLFPAQPGTGSLGLPVYVNLPPGGFSNSGNGADTAWGAVNGSGATYGNFGSDVALTNLRDPQTGTPAHETVLTIPAAWTGGSVDISILALITDGSSGNVKLLISTLPLAAGSSNTFTFNTASPITVATGANATLFALATTGLNVTGAVAGGPMIVKIARDNTVGSNYGSGISIASVIVKFN